MEHSFDIKLTVSNDGTHWIVYANRIPIEPKFKMKDAADVYVKCLRKSIRGLALAISAEMEK